MSAARLPRLVAVFLSGIVVADLASVAIRAGDHGPATPPSPRASAGRAFIHGRALVAPDRRVGTVTSAGARSVLAQRAAAVLTHNRRSFLATVDPHASRRFRQAQAQEYDALAAVPFATWSYALEDWSGRPLRALSARLGAPAFAPRAVILRYELRRFDTRPTTLVQYFTFVQRAGRWFITRQPSRGPAGPADHDIWDYGRVVVVRTPTVLVLGHPGAQPLMSVIASEAAAAIPRVASVWGRDWSRRVVILVPQTTRELAGILGGDTDLTRIAAVASAEISEDGLPADDAGDRVAVNPPIFARLSALGRQIVLTHEVTHVASRAFTGPLVPDWLVEGLADYIGFRGTGAPVTEIAQELRTDVLAGDVPTRLPTDAAFSGEDPRLPQVYEEAWLACRMIVQREGQARLVALYRYIGGQQSGDQAAVLRAALLRYTGMTTRLFVARWRAYVRAQLL